MHLVQVAERHSAVIDTGLRKAPDGELEVQCSFRDLGQPSSVRAEVWLRAKNASEVWGDAQRRQFGDAMIASGPILAGSMASLVLGRGAAGEYAVRFIAEIGGVSYIRGVLVEVR